jgi:hypothetical protein
MTIVQYLLPALTTSHHTLSPYYTINVCGMSPAMRREALKIIAELVRSLADEGPLLLSADPGVRPIDLFCGRS